MRKRLGRGFTPAAFAVLLASALSAEGTAQAQQPVAEITIRADNFAFVPDEVTVASGEVKITLVNDSWFIPHALAFEGGIVERIERVGAGASAQLVIPAVSSGRYTFFCPVWGHRALGMVGTLVVGRR